MFQLFLPFRTWTLSQGRLGTGSDSLSHMALPKANAGERERRITVLGKFCPAPDMCPLAAHVLIRMKVRVRGSECQLRAASSRPHPGEELRQRPRPQAKLSASTPPFHSAVKSYVQKNNCSKPFAPCAESSQSFAFARCDRNKLCKSLGVS